MYPMTYLRTILGHVGAECLRTVRFAGAGFALFTASTLLAQMVSIPLGGPRPDRPSPNASLLGAPAGIADAVAAKGRPAAMRHLDEAYHPAEVLEFLGLSRGVRVLVVEHDAGYYGEIIAAAVGSGGKAVELVPPAAMQDPATRTMLSDDISLVPNLALLAASPATVRLVPDSFDFVLLHLVDDTVSPGTVPDGHHGDFGAFLAKLFIAVRPGGVVGFVGLAAQPSSGRRDTMAGDDAARVTRYFVQAGFLLDNRGRLRGGGDDDNIQRADDIADADGAHRFILRFRKPE